MAVVDLKGVARYRKTTIIDANGEIVSDTTQRVASKNGSGYVISYSEKMSDFLISCSTGSIVRLFVYIAHHQNFGKCGIYGFRTSYKSLSQVLKLDRKSIYTAINYLKEKFLVNVVRIDGYLEFMVNPDYVTIGTDKKARVKEWNERWARYWKENPDG